MKKIWLILFFQMRKRIKLQDKNALEKFSEFYYVLYGKKTDVAYVVIKPNGKVVNIDLSQACIGSISEVYDAEQPHTPRGCIAQAWSVAEVLRCWTMLNEETNK